MTHTSSNRRVKDLSMGLLKLLVALALAIAAYSYVEFQASDFQRAVKEKALASPAAHQPPPGDPTKPSAENTPKRHQIPGTVADFEKAAQGMKETSDLLVNWAIVLFGGTIGIAVLSHGAKIRDKNWGLTLVPPAWVLLYASLAHGAQFKGALTYQLAVGEYIFRDLNLELFLQQEFFKWSVIALVVLALWYLFFRFALLEDRTSQDGST